MIESLGDLLKTRYAVNSVRELKKLGQTREQVEEEAANTVRTLLSEGEGLDIDAEFRKKGWVLKEWSDSVIALILDEVYSGE